MNFNIAFGSRERLSPFFDSTVKAGVTHFTIYNHMYMPVSYGDPVAEYERLINGVAIWDVAAERQVEMKGADALRLARYLTTRNLKKFSIGQGKYVPVCDHEGNLLNDPILLKLAEDHYWLSIADLDLLHFVRALAAENKMDVKVCEPDVSPLAVQGPLAEDLIADLFGQWIRDIRYFWFEQTELDGIPLVLMRSGWSKQGGFELFLQNGKRGNELWDKIMQAGEKYQIGPGAPNYIERIESGLLSLGADTLPDSSPFEVGLDKLVHLDSDIDFVGKAALKAIREKGVKRKQVGLFIEGNALSTNAFAWNVFSGDKLIGRVSALAWSPRLESNIGIALLQTEYAVTGGAVRVEGEGNSLGAKITELPFIAPRT